GGPHGADPRRDAGGGHRPRPRRGVAGAVRLRRPGRRRPKGRSRMRSRPLLVLLALALGACAQAPAAPEDAAQGDTAAEAVPVESTALERALRRVDGPFPDYLEFVDRSDALGREAPVSGLAHHGRRAPEVLGVDPEAADAVIAVGRKPRFATLLIGGQDGDAVRARAQASGWADRDGALRRDLDLLNEPLTVEAANVRPLGADVALGGP